MGRMWYVTNFRSRFCVLGSKFTGLHTRFNCSEHQLSDFRSFLSVENMMNERCISTNVKICVLDHKLFGVFRVS